MAQGTIIHGIAASENLDSSGEIISIAGLDSSSLTKDGVINWAHKSDNPSQVVGKIIYEKRIFTPEECENDHQLYFWNKCKVPYLYIVAELFDGQGHSAATDLAAIFRYDVANKDKDTNNVISFSIEGAKIAKEGNVVTRSIARKVTCDPLPCNKIAIAEMVSIEPAAPKKNQIDEIFKTEIQEKAEIFTGELKKYQPKLTVANSPATSIGQTRSGKNISPTARIHDYADFHEQDHRDAASAHLNMASKLGNTDFKQAQHHRNKGLLHTGAANTLMDRASRLKNSSKPAIKKAIDAGSGNVAPSQLTGGSVLAKETVVKPNAGFGSVTYKPGPAPKTGKVIMKSKWLARAEQEYASWSQKNQFESLMAKKMPHLTKTEIMVMGQVVALNRSLGLEKALSSLPGFEYFDSLAKAGGQGSIFTLILFDGCDLHDILHCSHFATDATDSDTYSKIEKICDEYFKDSPKSTELEFNESGELGKKHQKVLFLTGGEPYKDLFDKLDAVAPYKYDKFKPHISVTTNVDTFKGKASSLVISVNGEVKKKYDFK